MITTNEQAEEILNQNRIIVGIVGKLSSEAEAANQKRKAAQEPAHLFLLKGKSIKTIYYRFVNGNFKVETAGREYLVSIKSGQQNSILIKGDGPANLNHKIKSIVRI